MTRKPSQAEMRALIRTELFRDPSRSSNSIAIELGCAANTVIKERRALQIANGNGVGPVSSQIAKVRGRDGALYPASMPPRSRKNMPGERVAQGDDKSDTKQFLAAVKALRSCTVRKYARASLSPYVNIDPAKINGAALETLANFLGDLSDALYRKERTQQRQLNGKEQRT
jgi:hypothetical protein